MLQINKTRIAGALRIAVLVASVGLIVLISIDVFTQGLDFPFTGLYMKCQVPVCILYLADFFVELFFSGHRGKYLSRHWFYFLISIPYSWIVQRLGLHPTGVEAYILHFMPTLRATFALAIVVGFVSKNPVIGLFASYASILLLAIYFSSLIFFLHEGGGINPGVNSYWAALWWCCLQATTLGASFYAMTTVGKAIAMALSVMGMLMFPLFTVYVTQMVKKYLARKPAQVSPDTSQNHSAL